MPRPPPASLYATDAADLLRAEAVLALKLLALALFAARALRRRWRKVLGGKWP